MDLADCGSPERLIQTILRHHPDWTPPFPIEALAAAVNILEIRDLDTTSFEGALLTDPDKSQGIILCRPGVPGGRRRFTIGHELGHFLIPTHVGNQQCTQAHLSERGFATPAQRREAEANRFAAGILMPKPWFERDADQLGVPEVGHLRKLARSYDVSLEAAANRFVELTSTPCAVVFSYEGVVRYARSHVSFPRLAVERKSRLPSDCATKVRPNAGAAAPSDWIEMDGTIWLQHDWGRPAPPVLEQVLRQTNGHAVTMLLLADGPTDDKDEEEDDVAARWRPRF
jgi:Zn-dependent peptidase ImmA (M78 family)